MNCNIGDCEVIDLKKVITYGTFDLFHYGHQNLLKRAKELGDYLIVGVTSEDFDINRGKLNVQQSLMERIKNVKESGYADEIIVEEYEGQKIDDIQKYDIDIFAIGSDWTGNFDYLKEYCKVVYLERTKGVSSSELREKQQSIIMGIIGKGSMIDKFISEAKFVSGVTIGDICEPILSEDCADTKISKEKNIEKMLEKSNAVYVLTGPATRGEYVKKALKKGCHVICESPISLKKKQTEELYNYAEKNGLILFEALKTAYMKAFTRLIVLLKGGIIGDIKAIDATCTSMQPSNEWFYNKENLGGSLTDWGPFVLLPVFKIFGLNYKKCSFVTDIDDEKEIDTFTHISLLYEKGIANLKVGYGVKSEGDLVISGTKGYIYVPSPWWKTDYFEVRYENFYDNKRYFYKIDGTGERYEIAEFMREIRTKDRNLLVSLKDSYKISEIMEKFMIKDNCNII